jgi:putative transcriptional regulator
MARKPKTLGKYKCDMKYKSDIMHSVHSAMADLAEIGVVDKTTMRQFDHMCLTAIGELGPKDIAAIREKAGVSQGVFARYLNVPTTLVSQWERGERRPTGAAVKLLSIVKHKGLEAIA